MLDISISIITIAYMYLLSRKIKSGLYIGIFAQFVWLLFIYENKAWGLIPLTVVLGCICISGIIKWED